MHSLAYLSKYLYRYCKSNIFDIQCACIFWAQNLVAINGYEACADELFLNWGFSMLLVDPNVNPTQFEFVEMSKRSYDDDIDVLLIQFIKSW